MDIKRGLFLARLKARRNQSILFGLGVGGTTAALTDPDKRRLNPATGQFARGGTAYRLAQGANAGLLAGIGHGVASAWPGVNLRQGRGYARRMGRYADLADRMGGGLATEASAWRKASLTSPKRSPVWLEKAMHPLKQLRAKRIIKLRDQRYSREMGIRLD